MALPASTVRTVQQHVNRIDHTIHLQQHWFDTHEGQLRSIQHRLAALSRILIPEHAKASAEVTTPLASVHSLLACLDELTRRSPEAIATDPSSHLHQCLMSVSSRQDARRIDYCSLATVLPVLEVWLDVAHRLPPRYVAQGIVLVNEGALHYEDSLRCDTNAGVRHSITNIARHLGIICGDASLLRSLLSEADLPVDSVVAVRDAVVSLLSQ